MRFALTTPLIICALLIVPALLGAVLGRLLRRDGGVLAGGAVGLALAYGFFAMGHFVMTDGMVEMLPGFVPFRRELIWATGVWEIVVAVGLLAPASRRWAGLASIATLILFFPANVYAAVNGVGLGGHQWGAEYLFVRGPLQLLLIGWSYYFAVRRPRKTLTVQQTD